MKTAVFIISLIGFVGGCANPDELIFRDPAGNVVATATLSFPDPLPVTGQSFEGSWELKSSKSPFPVDSTKSGKYTGDVQATGVSINLNVGVQDDNVELFGSLPANHSLTGKWYFDTQAGGKEMGTFTVTRPVGR